MSRRQRRCRCSARGPSWRSPSRRPTDAAVFMDQHYHEFACVRKCGGASEWVEGWTGGRAGTREHRRRHTPHADRHRDGFIDPDSGVHSHLIAELLHVDCASEAARGFFRGRGEDGAFRVALLITIRCRTRPWQPGVAGAKDWLDLLTAAVDRRISGAALRLPRTMRLARPEAWPGQQKTPVH